MAITVFGGIKFFADFLYEGYDRILSVKFHQNPVGSFREEDI